MKAPEGKAWKGRDLVSLHEEKVLYMWNLAFFNCYSFGASALHTAKARFAQSLSISYYHFV